MPRLPVQWIRGKRYFRDDRLREFRSVDSPHDRITFAEHEQRLIDDLPDMLFEEQREIEGDER